MHFHHHLPLTIIGLAAGTGSALLGIGGGLILIPGLVILTRMEMQQAVALSLVSAVPIATFSALLYTFGNFQSVQWLLIASLIVGGVIGSWLGVHLLHEVSHKYATYFFAGLLVLLSLHFINFLTLPSTVTIPSSFALLLGLPVGIISGFFGITGGVVLVPTLIQVFGFDPAIAVMTSLLCLTPIAGAGAYMHHAKNIMPYATVGTIVLGAFAGVLVGMSIAPHVSAQALTNFFAVLLIVIAAYMAHSAYKE
ncbi:MAG: sulfite exporter TauE/SafE family protein [Candidatus Woesearchaeota archaeon]